MSFRKKIHQSKVNEKKNTNINIHGKKEYTNYNTSLNKMTCV